jgi:glyoxylase-like metal-dependent hydrolase (beta-lactamase superfamily II)
MRQIEQDIYLSDDYPGVTLGVVSMPYGNLMIDSPPNPDNGRAWKAATRGLGRGVSRLMLNLDSHIDRTLGARALDCPVMAHAQVADELDKRPTIFKSQFPDTGSEWELCDGLSGLRWLKPSLTFTDQAILDWGADEMLLEYHPGPDSGSIWLILPEPGVIFVGDAVAIDQPPFLGNADIPIWADSLNLLLSKAYRDYIVVSSRGGIVEKEQIRDQRALLRRIQQSLNRLQKRNAPAEDTANLIAGIMNKLNFPVERRDHYAQRLRHGLREYYIRHYMPPDEEEAE